MFTLFAINTMYVRNLCTTVTRRPSSHRTPNRLLLPLSTRGSLPRIRLRCRYLYRGVTAGRLCCGAMVLVNGIALFARSLMTLNKYSV